MAPVAAVDHRVRLLKTVLHKEVRPPSSSVFVSHTITSCGLHLVFVIFLRVTMPNFNVFNRDKVAQDLAVGPDAVGEMQADTEVAMGSDTASKRPSEDVQAGVKKVEAVTLVWTKKELIFAYAW